jgi:DNA primase large subunit
MDEEWLDEYVRSLLRTAEKPINYVELKALIRRFLQLNPDADPFVIDWIGVWDPTLTYSEQVEAFQRNYPGFRWEAPKEVSEEAFEQMRRRGKLEDVIEVIKELDEESLKGLLELIKKELGEVEEVPAERKEQEVVAIQEPTPAPTITLKTLSKYPILPEAREFFEAFEVEELDHLAEATKIRLIEAIERGEKGVLPREDPIEDLLTFGLARVLCIAVGEPWLLRRWALAEASRIERFLHTEESSLKELVLKNVLNVEEADQATLEKIGNEYRYKMRFNDYLNLIKELHGIEWRLVNRMLVKGYVYLTVSETIRLLRTRVYQQLSSTASAPKITIKQLPAKLQEVAEDIVKELMKLRSAYAYEMVAPSEDWPPCMEAIKARIAEASHKELFTIAAFLVNRGYTTEQILMILAERPDFNERIARYQVEHIAGLRGSRTKYRPPSCQTMKSLGLCVEDGRRCPKWIKNPLEYRKPEKPKQTTQTPP